MKLESVPVQSRPGNGVMALFGAGVIFLLFSTVVLAETAEEKGLNIVRKADRQDSGWNDSTSRMKMLLLNRHGEKRERTMMSRALEVADDGDKRLIIFEFPPDMRGTGFLTYSHKQKDDDQWLYLPALKRVKRIASRNKSESFLGSEFAYEDIAGEEIEKYSYRWLRDEIYEERPCHIVESRPVDMRNSGYSRRISWIDMDNYYLHRIDFYDRRNTYLKTLTFGGYHQYLGQYWRPDIMEMVNHQNERTTRMIWEFYQFQTGLDETDFSQRSLKRGL
ncbi:MAG: outer membrane lipoprotein-sorting protein [Mariprofundaceae bacterium]|nr:outer membrane lipoprotein-sorting protein [Mariprofundaceae bacterium]